MRTMKLVRIAVIMAAVAAAIGVGLVLRSTSSVRSSGLVDEPEPMPRPTSFRSEELLISGRLPEGWSADEAPGQMAFSISHAYESGWSTRAAAWVSVILDDPDRTLDSFQHPPRSDVPMPDVTDVTIDTRPALKVQIAAQRTYYVKNLREELLVIKFEERTPVEEIEAFLSHLRFFPPRALAPDARFKLHGQVGLLTGNCMPPIKCKPRGIQREVIVRGIGPDFPEAEIVARAMSDENGAFAFELPPGRYQVLAIKDGNEWCSPRKSCGASAVRIIDQDVKTSVVIDEASH